MALTPATEKAPHIPVLLNEILDGAKDLESTGWFVDGTFGRGGHTRELLKAHSGWSVLALDCDAEAVEYGRKIFSQEIAAGRMRIAHAEYSNLAGWIGELPAENRKVIGSLLDLGVSSPQLDEGRRGFSFYHDGPLDMRMDASAPVTAADIVNSWSEKELNDLFHFMGEVRSPFRVSRKIIDRRRAQPFTTTGELAELIAGAEGWRTKGFHPATNYFMALRIQVNRELERLKSALPKFLELLAPGGRLFVITFHSLEDRIVKNEFRRFAAENRGRLVNKKVIQASWSEKSSNPRARSAKLRIIEKVGEVPEAKAPKYPKKGESNR